VLNHTNQVFIESRISEYSYHTYSCINLFLLCDNVSIRTLNLYSQSKENSITRTLFSKDGSNLRDDFTEVLSKSM